MVAIDWQHGDFLGTHTLGQRQIWSNHVKEARLDHGHGKYLIDAEGIHFHRMHGGETFIPFAFMIKLERTKRFGGKYTVGDFITKVTWQHDGRTFESGFVFAKDEAQNLEIHRKIRASAARL